MFICMWQERERSGARFCCSPRITIIASHPPNKSVRDLFPLWWLNYQNLVTNRLCISIFYALIVKGCIWTTKPLIMAKPQ